MDDRTDHYRTLGVAPQAEEAVIRAAYLALMRTYHPDGAASEGDRDAAESRTKEINAAYAILGDPKRRAAYDLAWRPRSSASRVSTAGVAKSTPGKRFSGRRGPQKGPTLQARQQRLRKVRFISIGLVIGAIVMLFAAFTGAVGLLRPSVLDWVSGKPVGLGGEADDDASTGSVDLATPLTEVMLPWPELSDASARSFRLETLSVSFSPRAQVGRKAAVMTIEDTSGARHSIIADPGAPADRASLFGLGRLADRDRTYSVVVATWRGQACCMHVQVIYPTKDSLKMADLGDWPVADVEQFPTDIDGDGAREWVLNDRRFEAAFGPSTPSPPRIMRLVNGALDDVSGSGRFGQIFSSHIGETQRLCVLGSVSACAAFVGDAARLGRVRWAWDIMLANYGKDRLQPVGLTCEADSGGSACPSGSVDREFPAKLERFLKDAGYVSRQASLTPSGVDAE